MDKINEYNQKSFIEKEEMVPGKKPCDDQYSTARFYEQGVREFSFIKDLRDEF